MEIEKKNNRVFLCVCFDVKKHVFTSQVLFEKKAGKKNNLILCVISVDSNRLDSLLNLIYLLCQNRNVPIALTLHIRNRSRGVKLGGI